MLSLRTRHSNAGPHALADGLMFEFGNAGKDAEHQPSIGRRRVHTLMEGDKLNSERIEVAKGVHELAQAARKAVVAVDHSASCISGFCPACVREVTTNGSTILRRF